MSREQQHKGAILGHLATSSGRDIKEVKPEIPLSSLGLFARSEALVKTVTVGGEPKILKNPSKATVRELLK